MQPILGYSISVHRGAPLASAAPADHEALLAIEPKQPVYTKN